jgi:nucleoside-diphosphate-sugar epimerase
VTLLTRGTHDDRAPRHKRLSMLHGDRSQQGVVARLTQGKAFDVVIDMIAYDPSSTADAVAAFRGRTGRFIHCSTVSVYMVSNDVQCPITEDQDRAPLMPMWDRNPFGMDYGINKRHCERLLWEAHDATKFPVTVLRPTFVSGPADPARRDFFWIERILDGGPLLVPGSGDCAFQQVYVGDVARAFAAAAEEPGSIGKAYNVAAEEVFSLNDYLRALGALLGRTPTLVPVDQQMFDRLPFGVHPRGDVFPFNVRRTAILSLDRIKHDLRWRSTPWRTWMRETVDWWTTGNHGHSIGYERRKEEIEFVKKGIDS